MICPSCQAANEDAAEVCFQCRAILVAVTRGTVIASRYEVLSTLGRGGMGIVYKAHDRVLDEPVAIKLLRSDVAREADLTRRFRSEIKLARKVSHRNVCRIHEYGEDQGLSFISMEYLEGTDLKQVLRRQGVLPPAEAFEVALQAAQGLEAIHEAGIVHRDLKTPNIMRDSKGVVRLMDFGIAKQTGADATAGATATGQILGTPEYMSPEQARGQKADFRSDVYSLGVVLYEIFTGVVPFRGETPVATLFMHVQEPPPLEGGAASRIPPSMVDVLRRALEKDPADRYATAREMVEALREARATFQASAPTPIPPVTAVVGPDEPTFVHPVSDVRPARPVTGPTIALSEPDPPTVMPPGRAPQTFPGAGAAGGVRAPRTAARPPRAQTARASSVRGRFGLAGVGVLAAVYLALGWWPSSEEAPRGRAASPPPDTRAAPIPAPEGDTLPSQPSAAAPPLQAPSAVRAVPSRVPRTPPVLPASRPTPHMAALPSATPRTPPPTTLPAAEAPPPSTPAPAIAPAPVQPPPTVPAAAAEERGFLQLVVVPFAEVSVDGARLGRVSSGKLPLPAGSHTVVLDHPDYQPLRRRLTIVPGETLKLIVDISEEAIRKKK